MALRSTPEEQAQMQKKSQNSYLANPQAGLDLLARLLSSPEDINPDENKKLAKTKLTELKRLIAEDFTELCKQDNLPNEAEMHGKLNEAIEGLCELVSFPDLANKTVVGIGGSFSAGKSSFINSLLGKELLPNNVTPTTAIPTYLAYGKHEVIKAINVFGNAVPVDKDAVNALCHDFCEKYKVQPKCFIHTLNINTPDFPHKHLAFVDTPGYSNDNQQEISDRQIALEQLRLAEVLVWVVDIANGTLRQSDIEFIREVRVNDEIETCIPIFVILNKADRKASSELQLVIDEVKDNLKKARIDCSGIVAYDSISGSEIVRDGESISAYLDKVGRMPKPCRLQGRFTKVFEAYTSHNKSEEVNHSEQHKFFNEFKIRMGDRLSADEDKQLSNFISQQKVKIGKPKGLVAQFESLGHKVEELITGIFAVTKVEDEKPESMGVCGVVRVRNGAILAELKTGDEREGCVVKQEFLGIYVNCDFGDSILLLSEDIYPYYQMQDINIGSACIVKIIDIHRTNGDVKVVVTFGLGK